MMAREHPGLGTAVITGPGIGRVDLLSEYERTL
jgi:hypothetical protein